MNINGSLKLDRVLFTFSSERCAFSGVVHLHKLDVVFFSDTIHIHFQHQLHFSTVFWVPLCLCRTCTDINLHKMDGTVSHWHILLVLLPLS